MLDSNVITVTCTYDDSQLQKVPKTRGVTGHGHGHGHGPWSWSRTIVTVMVTGHAHGPWSRTHGHPDRAEDFTQHKPSSLVLLLKFVQGCRLLDEQMKRQNTHAACCCNLQKTQSQPVYSHH